MKNMTGRPRGTAFELYGYDAVRIEGKNIAVCRICNKKLQNTATKRLLGHRNVCSKDSPDLSKTRKSTSSISFKTEYNENFEDAMSFEDSLLETKFQRDSKANCKDIEDNNLYDEQVKHIQDYAVENPLSPVLKTNTLNNDINDVEIEDEDTFLQKMRIGKHNRKGSIPSTEVRSRRLVVLQEEKTKAETFFYRKKGAYFHKQTENSDIQRKLMILQSQKLRLEIEKIRNEL